MPEAVIVATGRTPIGRANKGSLVDCRPDDLAALVVKEVLAKVPELDPQTVEDVIMGSAQPAGEAGYNLARVAAVLAGLPDVPGVTVNRYCSSSLQTIRMAAHAIRAGEGDVFVAAGVETVSRYGHGAADTGPHNPVFAEAEARTGGPVGRRHRALDPPGRPARRLHRHGPDGRERRRVQEGVSRQEQDEFALQSQTRAVAAQAERVLRAGDHPGDHARRHGRDQGRRSPAQHHPRGAGPAQAGVPRGRHRHRRQRLPAQRRRGRRDRDERHPGPRARHHPAGPDRGQRGHRPQPRDHGPRPGRGHPPGAAAGPA